MSKSILSDNHWTMKYYKQRMKVADWKNLLLNDDDKIIYRGHLTRLIGKKLGYGVVEVSKQACDERNGGEG